MDSTCPDQPRTRDDLEKLSAAMYKAPKPIKRPALDLSIRERDEDSVSATSPTMSLETAISTSDSAATAVSDDIHAISDYERTRYYYGITGEAACPELLYRSNAQTAPFLPPTGRFAYTPVKSVYGVFDTPLNKVWYTVGNQVRVIVKAAVPTYSCIDVARFYSHGPGGFVHNPDGVKDGGSMGPVTIWVGVPPGSTSPDTAHDASQQILALLAEYDISDVVVEWRVAIVTRLSHPLLRSAARVDPTYSCRHFLSALHAIPLTTEGQESDDVSGTATLFMHVTVLDSVTGKPTTKVYGITNCHVLRAKTGVTYQFNEGESKDHVRVCSARRFQRGLDEIKQAISDAAFERDIAAGDLERYKTSHDSTPRALLVEHRIQAAHDDKNVDIEILQAFHDQVKQDWASLQRQRNIGHVVYAPAICVDSAASCHTADWGVFEADPDKFREAYEGNTVLLGLKFTPAQLKEMFSRGPSEFVYPQDGKLPLVLFASQLALDVPAERDSLGRLCRTVGKDGAKTGFTIGRFTGPESFTQNPAGVESIEYAVYNSGYGFTQPFSHHGDSGAVVWYASGGAGRVVGQLHSGANNPADEDVNAVHVTYLTPGWWLEKQILQKYPNAEFFRRTW